MEPVETSPRNRKHSSSPQTSKQREEGAATPNGNKKDDQDDGSGSPARCPICLAPPDNQAKSDSCSHYFCFNCLKEWSKVKAECPLCKMPIHSIFYNITSDSEYDEYKVEMPKPDPTPLSASASRVMDLSFHLLHARLQRDYFRRRRENELAARETATNVSAIRTRRIYYWNKQKVAHVDSGNRVRECSAEFFRENPSQVHRLAPWLRRELTVLYGASNKNLIDHVYRKIMGAIQYMDIDSASFASMIQQFMLDHTEQFIHEFLSFAKSPYTVKQYDKRARYFMPAHSSNWSSENRSRPSKRSRHEPRQYRNGHSRWDCSPDASQNLAEPSAQSVMLSQTSWSEDAPAAPVLPVMGITHPALITPFHRPGVADSSTSDGFINSNDYSIAVGSNPSMPYSSFYLPARSQGFIQERDINRDIEAPLVHQSVDLFRPGGSSARQYQQMEKMRRHIGDFQRNASEWKYNADLRQPARNNALPNYSAPVIVISDSSDDEIDVAVSSFANSASKTIHYKPSSSTLPKGKKRSETEERIKVKIEKSKKQSSSSDSSSESSNYGSDSDSSAIEFVRYIKPPHLRTPDAFIDLSSTDDDAPGTSSKLMASFKSQPQNIGSTSSTGSIRSQERENCHSSSPRSSHTPGSNEILERAKEFLQKARQATQSCSFQSENNETEETDPPIDVGTNEAPATSFRDTESEDTHTEHKTDTHTPDTCGDKETSSAPSASDRTDRPETEETKSRPKKVFERGKVSINFAPSRGLYSSSDSEIDVDCVEEVGVVMRPHDEVTCTEHQPGHRLEDVTDGDVVATCKPSSTAVLELQQPSSVKRKKSSERTSPEHSKHRKKRRRHSKHDDGPKYRKHRKHKKKKHNHRRSRSSSVEFVKQFSTS